MSIQIAKNLKKGDVVYECDYGTNIEITLLTEVTRTVEGDDVKYSWRAVSSDGRSIDYMISEQYSHYGPKLFLEPQY